jgi:hypothetical protein
VTPERLWAIFEEEQARFARDYPFLKNAECRIAVRHYEARPRPRDVAWCDTEDLCVYFLKSRLVALSPMQVRALVRHELAHLIDPDASERDTDVLAECIGGDPIFYGTDDIQTLYGGKRPRPARLGP